MSLRCSGCFSLVRPCDCRACGRCKRVGVTFTNEEDDGTPIELCGDCNAARIEAWESAAEWAEREPFDDAPGGAGGAR